MKLMFCVLSLFFIAGVHSSIVGDIFSTISNAVQDVQTAGAAFIDKNVKTHVIEFYTIIAMKAQELQSVPSDLKTLFDENLKMRIIELYEEVEMKTQDIQKSEPVTPDKVNFYLFTKENPDKYIRFDRNNMDILYEKKFKLVFLVHGWRSSKGALWFEDVKNSFLQRDEEYYVIQVDWNKPANQFYTNAADSTYDVAELIANLIEDLHVNSIVELKRMILVGHSLGAHVCGFVGKRLLHYIGLKLPRIVALDPAGPLFTARPSDSRLHKRDAQFVHVIHTDTGLLGYTEPCGTIDFYPNGGYSQPGCKKFDLNNIIATITGPFLCDHTRAGAYFTEAILFPQQFRATRCNSWEQYKSNACDNAEVAVGNLTTTLKGNFYLETNDQQPYSKSWFNLDFFRKIGKTLSQKSSYT